MYLKDGIVYLVGVGMQNGITSYTSCRLIYTFIKRFFVMCCFLLFCLWLELLKTTQYLYVQYSPRIHGPFI